MSDTYSDATITPSGPFVRRRSTSRAPSDRERYFEEGTPEYELPFALTEYNERRDRLRAALDAVDVDVVFLSSPEAMCWISGFSAEWYQGQSSTAWWPASGIAVHRHKGGPVHFDIEDEWVLAKITSATEDIRIHGRDSKVNILEFVVSELDALGWLAGARVGLELWSSRPHRGYSEMFQAALEARGAVVVDTTRLVRKLRRSKSPQELACVRTAGRIADIGMAAAAATIRAGVTELEVYGEIVRAMAAVGGENTGIPMPVASGAKSACVHALASRRMIVPGDIVNVDVSGVFKRYHSNMARTFSVGEPTPAVAKRCEQVSGAATVVADCIRPGLPVRELLERVESYYREEGIFDDYWWVGGYELGIAFPPDWVGEFLFEIGVDPADNSFIVGDVCNYEANFYLPQNAGVSMSINTMVFDSDRAELNNRTPNTLQVVGT